MGRSTELFCVKGLIELMSTEAESVCILPRQ
jgi:hypothetical protein